MAIGLRLDLRQSQQLVMTPQLQQAIKLLQMSNLEIADFVADEIERNPLLELDRGEEVAAPAERDAPVERLDERVTTEGDLSLVADTFSEGAEHLVDPSPGDGPPPLGPREQRSSGSVEEWSELADRVSERPNLRAHLLAQIGLADAPAMTDTLARHLVEELDEHGFLRADLSELAFRLGAELADLEAALRLLQGCEPTGVGARDLPECLALQLADRNRLDPAMRALLDNLALLERGELRALRQVCGVDEADFADMLAEIRALDPRPCAGFETVEPETLIPDILLTRAAHGGWSIELNSVTLPRLIMNEDYRTELPGADGEVRNFMAECRSNASWLIKSLDQRARTILRVVAEIVRRQDGFFERGVAGLRPLTLKTVAEAIDLHESTVSRVTSNKYVATERGIFELKFFFTNAVGGEEGAHAAEAVRHRIRALVDAERPDQVLSDDTIVERLQSEGIDIARRTVAKYRKALKIPSSVDRRRAKAMASR